MPGQQTRELRITNASIAVTTKWYPDIHPQLARDHERSIMLRGPSDDRQHRNPFIVALYESYEYPELDFTPHTDEGWSSIDIYLPPAAFDSFWQIALVRRSLEVRISLRLNDTGQPTNILFLALGDPETEKPSPAEL